MSDTVKLIIEIPQDYYEALAKTEMILTSPRSGKTFMSTIYSAVANGTPLDDVKAEFINSYPSNYMGEPELGGASCHFSLNKVLQILDNIGNESEE